MILPCCLNMAFNLTKPIRAMICLHDVTREGIAAMTDYLADVFVHKNVAPVFHVVAMLWNSKV